MGENLRMGWQNVEMHTIVHHLAYVQLARHLRPRIKRQSGFTVCCVLEDLSLENYFAAAANALFPRRTRPEPYSPDIEFCMVRSGDKRSQGAALFRAAAECYRCILVYEDADEIPAFVRDGADGCFNIGNFDKHDIASAFKCFMRKKISDQQADYLSRAPWEVLGFSFSQKRTFQEGWARVTATLKARDLRAALAEDRTLQTKQISEPLKSRATLEGLVTSGPLKSWALTLKQEIHRVRLGQIDPTELDKGVILSGPPGTGKTHFARVLADDCGVPFIRASYGSWQAAGHMGEQLKAMGKTFREASEASPCVLLIDEIDSFASREKSDSDYSDKIVNSLLEHLDGQRRAPGVVVVGTTNNLEIVDPAITRSGRFSEIFRLQLPIAPERVEIFRKYIDHKIPADLQADFIVATDGFSGADLEELARKARRELRVGSAENLSDAIKRHLPEVVALSENKIHETAIHEAGHAVVAATLGLQIAELTIVDRVRSNSPRQSIGRLETLSVDFCRTTRDEILNNIAVCFGGAVAETMVLGSFDSGAGGDERSDLVRATDLATLLEGCLGMGATDIAESASTPLELRSLRHHRPELRQRVSEVLSSQKVRASGIIAENQSLVEKLAAHLRV